MHSIYPVTTFDSTITYPSVLYPSPQYTTGTTAEQAAGSAFFTSKALLHLPDWSSGAGRPAIICCHGRGNTALSTFGGSNPSAGFGAYTRALVDAGFVLLALDFGTDSWSNNLAMRLMDQAYTYLTGLTGRSTVGIIGTSMGTNNGLQWHRRHPDLVAATYLFSAFADLDTVHGTAGWPVPYSMQPTDPNYDLFPPGSAPTQDQIDSVNAAYRSTTDALWTANVIVQGHTPARYPRDWTGRYIRFQHAVRDAGVPYQSAQWFVNAVDDPKCTLRLVTATTADHIPWTHTAGGGSDATILANGGVPPSEVRDYFYGLM